MDLLLHTFVEGKALNRHEFIPPSADERSSSLDAFSRDQLATSLVAAGYFDIYTPKDYEMILSFLNRTDLGKNVLPAEIHDLKRFELMIRCGLIPGVSFDDFSSYTKKYLLHMRAREVKDSPVSDIDQDLSKTIESIASESVLLVSIGPYRVSFGRPAEPGIRERTRHGKQTLDIQSLMKRYMAVSSLEGIHGGSDRIKRAILTKLGMKLVLVKAGDWTKLKSEETKNIFMHNLIAS